MKDKINSYFAILIITIAGAGATTLIVHVAGSQTLIATMQGSGAHYTALQNSILKK